MEQKQYNLYDVVEMKKAHPWGESLEDYSYGNGYPH